MRVLKNDIYRSILKAARSEFLNKGFKEASMRNISQKADVGLSNIYNYFKNKDEIFEAIVKPAKDEMFTFITRQHTEEYIDFNKISPFGHQEEAMEYYINLIYKYKDEYHLLLYRSQGSSLDNFREALGNHITKVSHNYMELEKKYNPEINKISPFFIHVMSSWMVSILGEIVIHNLSKRKIREFFREYFRFSFAGWRELTGI